MRFKPGHEYRHRQSLVSTPAGRWILRATIRLHSRTISTNHKQHEDNIYNFYNLNYASACLPTFMCKSCFLAIPIPCIPTQEGHASHSHESDIALELAGEYYLIHLSLVAIMHNYQSINTA